MRPCGGPAGGRVALVAGWPDVAALRGRAKMIYVEHGAGQTYAGDEKSAHWSHYSASGGYRHTGVIGFISPSETVAARWKTAPAAAVGCAKLDRLHLAPSLGPGATVCFAWHWDADVCPEARWAFPHYADHLPTIVERFALAVAAIIAY